VREFPPRCGYEQHAQQTIFGDAADFDRIEAPLGEHVSTSCSRPRSATSTCAPAFAQHHFEASCRVPLRHTRKFNFDSQTPRDAISQEELVSPRALS